MSVHAATIGARAAAGRSAAAPWFLHAGLFASTSVLVGVLWDISWHQSIGRDTFWTWAHLAIYLGGVVAGLTCGWLALSTTFAGTPDARGASVRFWGFSAPLGAWVSIWGTFAMLTSAPFDDWWHNTYGLDVKILSPPHALLASGIGAIQVGAMLMIVAWQNRSAGANRRLSALFVLAAGLHLLNASVLATEYTQRWNMHQGLFWMVASGVFPFFLASSARASVARWPATSVALVYTAVTLIMLIVLPLFPARPLLGPIFVPLDRFVPPDFPLLLVVPAFAIDLVLHRLQPAGRRRDWLAAAAIGAVFLVALLAVQWPFADFLMTPWARNWFFGTTHMAFSVPPAVQARWYRLSPAEGLASGLPLALLLGFASARCGLWWGNWMSRVQR
jgi:hypothetical protein